MILKTVDAGIAERKLRESGSRILYNEATGPALPYLSQGRTIFPGVENRARLLGLIRPSLCSGHHARSACVTPCAKHVKSPVARQVLLIITLSFSFGFWFSCSAQDVKQPNVAGDFYPSNPVQLGTLVDEMIEAANPKPMKGEIFALISPHAGYGYSGPTAAYGYRLIKDKPYKTVIVIGVSHHYAYDKISVYPQGAFSTPLGEIDIDTGFTRQLLYRSQDIVFEPLVFNKEHSVEVQLPFLQRVLAPNSWRLVPVVMGDCTWNTCNEFAKLLKEAIGNRQDVLVVASSDMYHGYDYEEADIVDALSLAYLEKMQPEEFYYALREGSCQFCGGLPIAVTLILAKELGHNQLSVLHHTNSAIVTNRKTKGTWTVGYASCAIDQPKEEKIMLNQAQRKKLLEIARKSIEAYLKTGKKLEVEEVDSVLNQEMGAFVTLHKHGELRGCIGNLVGTGPLYLTVRDMAVEAATGDPRFPAVSLSELPFLEIEISALSPMKLADSADEIELGRHGVLVRKGIHSGVFLPQVATETGWSKEEFLSSLCAHKAGLPSDCWKDKNTELYIFTAEVFSEKNY